MSDMPYAAWFLIANATSLACVVLAAIGMAYDWDTWGWLLLIAAITAKAPPGYHCACRNGGCR
jgi:hypothetical protein